MNTSYVKLFPLLLGGIAFTAQANPINGQINIQTGNVVLTPNQLGAVVSVGTSTNGKVTSVEGAYPTNLDGDSVTYKSFNVTFGAQSISGLWSVTEIVSPFYTYTFNLGSITSIVQTSTNLSINGTGTLASTDPTWTLTSGLWSYGINSADGSPTSGNFSFQSNNTSVASVADGANTLVLFGVGLMAVVGIGKKFRKVTAPKPTV
jgi:hypothetical protein